MAYQLLWVMAMPKSVKWIEVLQFKSRNSIHYVFLTNTNNLHRVEILLLIIIIIIIPGKQLNNSIGPTDWSLLGKSNPGLRDDKINSTFPQTSELESHHQKQLRIIV